MAETAFSAEVEDLKNLAEALSTAVNQDFMAREHAKSIWMNFLKKGTDLDVPKKQPTPKTGEVEAKVGEKES